MNKLLIFLLFIIKTSLVQAIETPAKQGILYDYETKTVLFEKNSDELMSPSSMSKIMTIYYLFKKIKDGEISIDDEGAVKPVDLSRPCINRGEAIAVFFWGGNSPPLYLTFNSIQWRLREQSRCNYQSV